MDLQESFTVLRQDKIKFNPEKCAFSIESLKFLGFMVLEIRIKASLEKVKDIMDMSPP